MRTDVVARRCSTAGNRSGGRQAVAACLAAVALFVIPNPGVALTITPNFTAAFNSNFGVNAVAAQNAWIAAANVFTTNFSDNVHINITVDAVAGTSIFGQSQFALNSLSYAGLRTLLAADATSADDITSTGIGGSIPVTDPIGGIHTWWVSRAQGKAIGLLADDLLNDGTTRFGAGTPFTFSGPIAPGTFDFRGIALHEISEVMGRIGISGDAIGNFTNSYSLIDLLSYFGPGARALTTCPGAGAFFSIDNGATLLKEYNDACSNNRDTRDWATGTNDAFNQFSSGGVINPLSVVDARVMDVIGYNRVATVVPEPSTLLLGGTGLALFAVLGIRRRQKERR